MRLNRRRKIVVCVRFNCGIPIENTEDFVHLPKGGTFGGRPRSVARDRRIIQSTHVHGLAEYPNRPGQMQVVTDRLGESSERRLERTGPFAGNDASRRELLVESAPTINHPTAVPKALQREVGILTVMRSDQFKPEGGRCRTLRENISHGEKVALGL